MKKNNKNTFLTRRLLAVLMIVMLVVSIVVPNVVWAEETQTTTNGYYDAGGEWHQGGDGTFIYNDGSLTLSKTANPVEGEDNIYEIMLKVVTKQNISTFKPGVLATVLIVDCSGSMDCCVGCGETYFHLSTCDYRSDGLFVELGQTRIYSARHAAVEFIDEIKADAPEGSQRYVNLVSFSDSATNRLADWQDIMTTSGYNAVKDAIIGLGASGATNLDDALGHASDLIDDERLSDLNKDVKNVIVLTDGNPTYYVDTDGDIMGNGNTTTETLVNDTVLAAETLRKKANVFTICYQAEEAATYSGGPTVGEFLKNSIASPATGNVQYAYNASDTTELINSFMEIVEIELQSVQVTITDPIPDNIKIPENGLPEGINYEDGAWSLQDVKPEEEINGETVTYTYTITYKVEIDPYAEGVEDGKFYPANKPTYVILSDGTSYEFPVPGIMPIPEKFEVTFNAGEHGSLEGEDEDGNVTEEVIKGKDTPTPPDVTSDDGWYFVGWTPEVSDMVDGEVTYTAVYSQKQVITITGNSSAVTYNGAEQTASGFSVTGLPDGWTVDGIDYSVSGKNAGSYTGAFSGTPAIRNENQQIVPAEQYTLVLVEGTLTIGKKDLTITADSDSKEYDGTALTDNGWTSSGVAGGDNVASVTVTGSQTLVGQSANVASGAVVMNGNADVTDNYNITYVDGTLEVTKNSNVITITADSASKIYDGTPLTESGYTYTDGILAPGDVLVATVQGSRTDAGKGVNQVVSWSVMRGDTPVTNYYTFAVPVNGTLTVEKRDLTITADSANKVYNGTPLTDSGWKDTAPTGLAAGDTITSVTVTGSQTVVGSSKNVASDAVIVHNQKDVTANYNITYVDGTLTVSAVGTPITITADSNSKIYDGLPLMDGGYTFTQGILADGDVLIVKVEGSITDVGTATNYVASYKVMRDGVDVTSFYSFTTPVDGTLTVTKRDLTITADSATKEYDSEELTDNGWMDTLPEGLATTDEVADVIIEGSQRVVGQSANVATHAYVVRGDEDVTDNYNIIFIDGTLTVTKNTQTITITAASDSKEYDGFPLTNSDYTYTEDVIGIFDRLIAEVEGSQTNAGSSPNKVVSYKVVCNGEDVTEYYTFATPVDGTLTVTKAEGEIIVTADSASKEYDGTPLTSDGYMANEEILAAGDELVVEIEGSQTFVGSSANKVVSVKVMRNGVDVTDNYNIGAFVDGTLTVTKVEGLIIVEADSASKEYDGTPLTSDGFSVYGDYLLADGDEIVAVIEGSQTLAGSSNNKVVSVKIMRGEKDVTDFYTLDVSDGVLTVTKVAERIVIQAASDSKEYDGTPLTNPNYTFTQGVLAQGDELVVEIEGSQTYVGSCINEVVSAKVMRGEKDVTDCYNISAYAGVLEVTAKANTITITAVSDSKTYDGTALVNSGYSFTQGILAQGDVLVVEVDGSQTFAGTSVNDIVSYKVMRGDKDVTDNYTIVTVDGILEVTKREIVITADSASKIYDGTALTDNGWKDNAPAGLADGDEIESVVVSGAQTDVGQSANVASDAVITRGNNNVTANYDITYIDGTLTVSKVGTPIIITAGSATKEYDGTPLTNPDYTFTQGVLAQGDELIVVIEGSRTDAGIGTNKVVSYKVMRGGVDVTGFYTFAAAVDGTLEITKRDITITADSASKEYDGTELTKNSFTVSGIVEGEQVQVTITGSQIFAGSSANVASDATITGGDEDVTANYNVTYVDGTLTVEKKSGTVTITAQSDSKQYDGTPLTNDNYEVIGELADGDELIVEIEGSQTFAGSSDNVVVFVKVMRDGVDVTDNYANLELVDGTLTIEKIETAIIITAGSSEKDYDGEPLTNDTYIFTEGILVEGDELVVVIEGSQTEVGSSANKIVSVKVMRGEDDVTDCYTIDAFVDGELVVNSIPETGDNTNIAIWNVMMFASILTLLMLAFTSKRKQRAK